jgi:hypothetical protein
MTSYTVICDGEPIGRVTLPPPDADDCADGTLEPFPAYERVRLILGHGMVARFEADDLMTQAQRGSARRRESTQREATRIRRPAAPAPEGVLGDSRCARLNLTRHRLPCYLTYRWSWRAIYGSGYAAMRIPRPQLNLHVSEPEQET